MKNEEADRLIRTVSVPNAVATPKETFLSCVLREDHDYIPMFLRDLTIGMDITGVRTTDVFTKEYDHKLSAASVKKFREFCGQDAVVGCIHSLTFNTEAFGGIVKYPEYGIPSVIKHPFENITDIPDVSLEPEGKTIGVLRSYSAVRESMPDVAVVANVEGPLTKAGTVTGIESMIMYLEAEKDLMDDIISLCADHTHVFLEHIDRSGSMDCVFLASATDNPDMFGYDVYRDFTVKHLKRMSDRIHRIGYPVIFHPHGSFTTPETEKIFDDTIKTGIEGFQFAEKNDPEKIISMIGGRCSVMGGTDVVPALLSGPAERIENETVDYINKCKDADYVFMCSCSLHRATPLENIKIMADTVHRYNGRLIDKKVKYLKQNRTTA
ncbi:MAG: uroporphyrinogen decarboxylase family protein [Methanomassiliicoccaceae archaeon]|nr:uroporphyrinogen decarboxylase family protein [Methanomassiliicoccaceae archaeon]